MKNPFTLNEWIQVASSIGQCISAVGAMLASLFAYITIREMKNQSLLQKSELLIQYGPKLHIEWIPEASNSHSDNHCFPDNEQEIERLSDKTQQRLFSVLCEWRKNPSTRAFPQKFITLAIQNIQAEAMVGTAKNIHGTLEIYVKNTNSGHPPVHYCQVDFNAGDCQAKNNLKLPIKVEGVPEFSVKLLSLVYNVEGTKQVFDNWSGSDTYSYSTPETV